MPDSPEEILSSELFLYCKINDQVKQVKICSQGLRNFKLGANSHWLYFEGTPFTGTPYSVHHFPLLTSGSFIPNPISTSKCILGFHVSLFWLFHSPSKMRCFLGPRPWPAQNLLCVSWLCETASKSASLLCGRSLLGFWASRPHAVRIYKCPDACRWERMLASLETPFLWVFGSSSWHWMLTFFPWPFISHHGRKKKQISHIFFLH